MGRETFPKGVKKDVRHDQEGRCAYCNGFCRGHGYGEPDLRIHHIVPHSLGGPNTRENAVGLCPADHEFFDELALKDGKLFTEVLLEEGRMYDLQRLAFDPAGGHRMPQDARNDSKVGKRSN